MNIHTYEKLWLVAAMVLIVGFIATITYGSVGLGIAMVDDSEDTLDPNEINDHEQFGDPGVVQVGENEYEAYVRAQTWTYNPNTIEVPENSEVTFYVTSPDVIHSFSLVGTNVNTMVIPGEVSSMTVEFDEPREYGVVCNEYCGQYHHDMEGTVEVVPEDEFDMTELSVDAPGEVTSGEEIEVAATVENGMLEDLETTVTADVGGEQFEEDVTVADSETVTFTVDAADLGEGDHDWTVTVDDYEESGQVTVTDGDDGGEDDE
ncbi:cytochrome c oxidase subunit II [Natronobacterium texcoconense]|uniref:Cytochrome c oxidase subunit 2 n=1 Tax=Natronobacterium texcoconense TaxID=1095778 RepID=A0A1H1HK30_NATTX|nr:cytochrome c oxidase subunit II [Natronobacterium texcoconense]SDR25880.1 cytochrome c oxidase subunit 2 [Natronobacterium texcoconense]